MEEDINNLIYTMEMKHLDSKPVIDLLNRLQELEKENKELKETYINPSKAVLSYYDSKKGAVVKINGFIPKSKIEDKIKELEETKLYGGKIHQAVTETEIDILKSLLEG